MAIAQRVVLAALELCAWGCLVVLAIFGAWLALGILRVLFLVVDMLAPLGLRASAFILLCYVVLLAGPSGVISLQAGAAAWFIFAVSALLAVLLGLAGTDGGAAGLGGGRAVRGGRGA